MNKREELSTLRKCILMYFGGRTEDSFPTKVWLFFRGRKYREKRNAELDRAALESGQKLFHNIFNEHQNHGFWDELKK